MEPATEKKGFFAWLWETYAIDWHEWDENYDPSTGQGKQIIDEYMQYREEG